MSAVVTTAIAVLCVMAWCACGVPAGRVQARLTYERARQSCYSWQEDNPQHGRGVACFAFILCMLAGPLSLLLAIVDRTVVRSVPALVEAEAAQKRAELARLQEQIDQAHRDLGIRPLGGAS